METQKNHWENVYRLKSPREVSWFQSHLEKSLEWIIETGIDPTSRIIDVGGGASTLVDDLIGKGYRHLTVLDISGEALQKAKDRLGEAANQVTWLESDITQIDFAENSMDLWHDRAVFHFLTKEEDRKSYIQTLKKALKPGGFLIMASFSLEGPLKCSGLEITRYSPETLSQVLGSGFSLLKSDREDHKTPSENLQRFVYCLFRKSQNTSVG